MDEEDEVEKKPSRKQKSLGLLCQKFLALYPDYPPPHSPIWISLDEVAANLGRSQRCVNKERFLTGEMDGRVSSQLTSVPFVNTKWSQMIMEAANVHFVSVIKLLC